MNSPETLTTTTWPLWRKLAFRFFAIFFLLQLAPWTWLDFTGHISTGYYRLSDWIVQAANRYVFHVKDVLVPMGAAAIPPWDGHSSGPTWASQRPVA